MSILLGQALKTNPEILNGTSADQTKITFPRLRYQWTPWRDWVDVTNSADLIGTRDFLYTVGNLGTNRMQVINNTDSVLYLSSVVRDPQNLKNAPESVIGPFGTANVTLTSDHVSLLARCFGYDFTSVRAIPSPFDVRGPSAFIAIAPIGPTEEPPLPVLRTSWARIYDKFDLTAFGNPLPATFVTNQFWLSNFMEFGGAGSIFLNAQATATATPTGGSTCGIFVQYDGIDTGLGNWNAGGGNLTANTGFVYVTNATVTLAANKPRVEIFFTPGDGSGCVVTLGDVWVTGIVHA